jgi:hypothetical protein
MKEFIKNTLVEMYKTTTTDKYGQVAIFYHRLSLFGEKQQEVMDYCKANKGILQFSTYGGSIGTYTAFTIEDEGIRKACQEALRTNENYLRNINSW